jgi:hypothetical protein
VKGREDPFNLRKLLRDAGKKRRTISSSSAMERMVRAGGTARVLTWLTRGPFAILSAHHLKKTPGQNIADDDALRAKVLEDGYGFYTAAGFYKGISEDSLLIPNLPLEKVLEYGRMFEPPQKEILWGQDGEYSFYEVASGEQAGGRRSVLEDFTILKELEVERLTKEKSDIGFTKVRRDTRPWTTDPRIKEWREKPKTSSYLVVTDPRYTNAMGNFEKVITGCHLSAHSLKYEDGRYSISLGMLMVVLPFPVEVPE